MTHPVPAPTIAPHRPTKRLAFLAGMAMMVLCGHAGAAPPPAGSDDLAARLADAVPAGTTLVVAEQNDQASIPWKLSKASEGVPYDVTFANFNGGTAVLEALIAGAADIGYVGEAPLPIGVAAGVDDLVAIGLIANPGSPGNYYLVTQPDNGIDTVEALRGKTVAYPPGTGRHMVLAGILDEHGLSLDSGSVKGIQLAGTEVAPTFSSRGVDAAIVLGQQYYRLGEPPILADGSGHNWGLNVLLVRRTLFDDPAKSAAVADFLRRAVQFYNWQGTNPEAWIRASYVDKQGLTFEQGKALLDEEGWGAFYPIDARAIEVFQEIADGLRDTGAVSRHIDIAPYVDPRFNDIVAWQNRADGVVPPDLVQPAASAAAE